MKSTDKTAEGGWQWEIDHNTKTAPLTLTNYPIKDPADGTFITFPEIKKDGQIRRRLEGDSGSPIHILKTMPHGKKKRTAASGDGSIRWDKDYLSVKTVKKSRAYSTNYSSRQSGWDICE